MSGWKGGTLGAYSLLSLPRGFTGREQHFILASLVGSRQQLVLR